MTEPLSVQQHAAGAQLDCSDADGLCCRVAVVVRLCSAGSTSCCYTGLLCGGRMSFNQVEALSETFNERAR